MRSCRFLPPAVGLLLAAGFVASARADGAAPLAGRPLLDVAAAAAAQRLTPTYGAKDTVSVASSRDPAAPGLLVTIQPGKAEYPGVELKPEGAKTWDLSAFGRVEARLVNTGSRELRVSLRVDNEGDWHDNPWSCEEITLPPGASGTVGVIFGYSFGHHRSFALKPAAISGILLYVRKSDAVQSFRIEALAAGGPAGETPPLDPNAVRIKPQGGVLLGPGVKLAATQIEAAGDAQGAAVAGRGGGPVAAAGLSGREGFGRRGAAEAAVTFKPAQGRWDLTAAPRSA